MISPRILSAVVALTLVLSGCANRQLAQKEFLDPSRLTLPKLAGTYQNQGQSIDGSPQLFMSALLLPSLLEHEDIDQVKLSGTDQVLRCSALKNGELVARASYRLGEHIKLKDNALALTKKVGCMGCSEGGGLSLVKPKVRQALYLTESGDAVVRSHERGLMVVMMMPLPRPVVDQDDLLFRRLPK